MPLCEKETTDKEGRLHKCGLPAENRDLTLVHVHVCGLPFMELPLDTPGTCWYNWTDAAKDSPRAGA